MLLGKSHQDPQELHVALHRVEQVSALQIVCQEHPFTQEGKGELDTVSASLAIPAQCTRKASWVRVHAGCRDSGISITETGYAHQLDIKELNTYYVEISEEPSGSLQKSPIRSTDSMSFFRRPDDSSSDSTTSDSSEGAEEDSNNDSNGTVDISVDASAADTTTEELAVTRSISNGDYGNTTNRDQLRDLALTSMLEELSKYKAAEYMNQAGTNNKGTSNFTKDSPEVQEFAKTLFDRSSRVLEHGNLLPAESARRTSVRHRQAFISELEKLGQQNTIAQGSTLPKNNKEVDTEPPLTTALVPRNVQQPPPFQNSLAAQWGQLNYELNGLNALRRPSSELPVSTLLPALAYSGRYSSNFEQQQMLGRGGFGRVYQAFNILDKQTYAIKQIPLSPSLASRYMQLGHCVLEPILREVQALAKLDHPNVIRYHASWLETGPSVAVPQPAAPSSSHRQLLLLANGTTAAPEAPSKWSGHRPPDAGHVLTKHTDQRMNSFYEADSGFDPFNRSHNTSQKESRQLLWSVRNSKRGSDSLGPEHSVASGEDSISMDASSVQDIVGPYLCVQTSMYPMTLDHYIGRKVHENASEHIQASRHCFHVVPAIRIALSILHGLKYIHAQGLLHRDVKPGNIFMNIFESPLPPLTVAEGFVDISSCPSCPAAERAKFLNPRIGDFGLVADLVGCGDGNGSGSSAAGTFFYRPPGHSGKSVLNEKFDIFSLGIILLELLFCCSTGSERYELLKETKQGYFQKDLVRDKAQGEGMDYENSQALEDCIMEMIHKDHHHRPSCDKLEHDLKKILDTTIRYEVKIA